MAWIFNENERKLHKIRSMAGKVDALADEYKKLSDEELAGMTEKFRARIADGEKLDDVLYDAYAAMREACDRVLGLRPFFEQVMGAIALHQGRIAEMATGEGKTLVAVLPAYLNALTGNGVHVVTVNDYLATRDAAWMGKVHRFMGLSVGVIVPGQSADDKRAAYACDITYCTNNELGFDFLRDNMVKSKSLKMQRGLNFAIIDEVDSILIDEARTPLIISGRGDKSNELYKTADAFVRTLTPKDYTIDEKEKTVMLTDDGVAKAERYFRVFNITDPENSDKYSHIQRALKAHFIMKRDRDYIVSDGEVLIVDEFTGRVLIGRRYNDGLHQAVEAKERVAIKNENKTLATITFQNFFRMYRKLSGMTGTAKTEEDEFKSIYALDVVTIPTHEPCRREDEHDRIYTHVGGKLNAIVDDIVQCHKRGQPVLVGTVSVEKSEELSNLLKRKGIRHKVLNAKNHKDEAEIIAQAGKVGAVTIATNMAGRGTDIMLGGNADYLAKARLEREGYPLDVIEMATSHVDRVSDEVREAREKYRKYYSEYKVECDAEHKQVVELGGLRVIGTERHDSRRIDNQLRGRSGRQGDPGSTAFYISMEDDIARLFGGDKMKSIAERMHFDDTQPIANSFITKQIERAQQNVESRNFSVRKQVLSYDDVMNAQREMIYKERGKVLDGLDVHDQIVDMIDDLAEEIITKHADFKTEFDDARIEAFNRDLDIRMFHGKPCGVITPELCGMFDVYKMKDAVLKVAFREYDALKAAFEKTGKDFGEYERQRLLSAVDSKWMEHIDAMDVLRRGIGLRGYGQRDPVIAYRQEGWEMFDRMVEEIHTITAQKVLTDGFIILAGEAIKNGTAHYFDEDNPDAESEDGMPLVTDYVRRIANAMLGALDARAAAISAARRNAAKYGQKNSAAEAAAEAAVPSRAPQAKVGRNDPCPCGSGKKYKNCCGRNA